MANVVITSENTGFKFDFGNYAGVNDCAKKSCFTKADVTLHLKNDNSYVDFKMRGSTMLCLTFDSENTNTNYKIVDSVDGQQPSSQDDLFEKLCTAKNTIN